MSRTKPDLSIRWSKRDHALLVAGSKESAGMLIYFVDGIRMHEAYGRALNRPMPNDDHTLVRELEARGYDLTTLRFSIRKKAP